MNTKPAALLVTAMLCVTLPILFDVKPAVAEMEPDSYPVDTLNMSGQQSEYDCLVEAIYYEAGNQPFVGKVAVAQVVVNRVNSRHHPDTVCNVVHEGPISQWWWDNHRKVVPIKHKCQFSYYCDGKDEEAYESKSWSDSEHAAILVLRNTMLKDVTSGATHYHADYVEPWWAKKLIRTVTIENHLFFKR